VRFSTTDPTNPMPPPPPMEFVPRDVQDAVLATLLSVLGDDGTSAGHSVFGPPSSSYYMYMQQKTGACTGLEQYCYGRSSVDVESLMVEVKEDVLNGLLRKDVLRRVLQMDAIESSGKQAAAAPPPHASGVESYEYFLGQILSGVSNRIFSDPPAFTTALGFSKRVRNPSHFWRVQETWLSLLASIVKANGDDTTTDARYPPVPSQIVAFCLGELSRIQSSLMVPFDAGGYCESYGTKTATAATSNCPSHTQGHLKHLLQYFDLGGL
jgi:hypothetical protein